MVPPQFRGSTRELDVQLGQLCPPLAGLVGQAVLPPEVQRERVAGAREVHPRVDLVAGQDAQPPKLDEDLPDLRRQRTHMTPTPHHHHHHHHFSAAG